MLVLISPPPTELDHQQIWLGNQDSQLSESARTQTEEFARYDMWVIPDRVYVSPANHVREFTRMILSEKEVEPLLEFTARSMGSLTGRSYRETLNEFPRRNWLAWNRSFWVAAPDGESFFDISERVLTTFRSRVLPVRADETVMIIASDDVLRLIIGYLTKLEEEDVPKIHVDRMVPYVINGVVELPV